jgi:pimeloyl-ACP methyl ester carboxylesterase
MELSHVVLDDGRRVDVATAGDPDGAPVLLQHGLPQSRLVAAHADDDARACGVRLLSLSRPGFGGSSRANPSLAERGDDAVEVAARLGADRFAVLGISFGGPAAAATAVRGGERVSALGLAVAMGPWLVIDDDEDDPELAEDRRIISRFVADGDLDAAMAAYHGMGHTAFDDLLTHQDDEALMQAFDTLGQAEDEPPEDVSWMTPEMRRRFARDIRESLTTYDGLALDNITAGREWDIDPQAIRQPTFLWYGDADTLLSIDHAHWWKAQVPHARLTIHEGQGHGDAYLTRWPEMLDELAATLR